MCAASRRIIALLVLAFCAAVTVHGQFNQCLRPPGCFLDECCFNIVPKTGEQCARIAGCVSVKDFDRDCCKNSRVVYTPYGQMYGYSLLLDDMYLYRDNGQRYLQIWLGVPYAKAPSRDKHLRFQRPTRPDTSSEKYDASYYRPSCPQPVYYLQNIVNRTVNEDCLYLNIFVLNQTITADMEKQLYPILVYFHGGEHRFGSANAFPGHVLAQLNVMVITVNYRLNAFGFVSSEDEEAPGNYGLWDQLAALEFIQEHARKFKGDPTRVTLMGYGSGAADIGLHMLSLKSGLAQAPRMFHRAILLGGSDLMEGGFVRERKEALSYTKELAFQIGCSRSNTKEMMGCLRERESLELASAADKVLIHRPGWLGRAWSPTIDGEFISDFPLNLRQAGQFARIPVLGGLSTDDGSQMAAEAYPNITSGKITREEFRRVLRDIAMENYVMDFDSVVDSLEFEYTHWPDPQNDTWRLQKLRQCYTDRYFGAGLDTALKFQSDVKPIPKNQTQMFVFKYRSRKDPQTQHLGSYHESMLQYIFGYVYFNNSNWQEVNLQPPGFYYADLDRNISEYMLYMISNFVIHGNATPDIIRNITWDTYRPENRTYLLVDLDYHFMEGFELLQDYHIFHYAFWRNLYPQLLSRLPRFSTPMPTPLYMHQFKSATFSLAGVLGFFVIIILCLTIVLVRRRKLLVSRRY